MVDILIVGSEASNVKSENSPAEYAQLEQRTFSLFDNIWGNFSKLGQYLRAPLPLHACPGLF